MSCRDDPVYIYTQFNYTFFYMQTATPNIPHQISELVEYKDEVADEVGLNEVFQQFIASYQEVYETYEQDSDDKQDNNNDTGTSCITDY